MKRIVLGLVSLGMLWGVAGLAQAGNIVVNGGFETGSYPPWTVAVTNDFTGLPPNPSDASVAISTLPGAVHSGKFASLTSTNSFSMDRFNTSYIQVLTTTPGQAYTLDFWAQYGLAASDKIEVKWDGSTAIVNPPNVDFGFYNEYTFRFTATGPTATLEIHLISSADFALDDVTATASPSVSPSGVPEPGSLTLLGIGLVGIAGNAWRRWRNKLPASA